MNFEKSLSRFESFCNTLETISEKVIILTMILMVVIVFIEVVTRLFLETSITWSGEIARFLLIWLVFIGASVAQKKGELIAIEFFINLYSQKVRIIIMFVCHLIVLFFVLLVSITGFSFMKSMIKFNQMSPGLGIPIWWMYLGYYLGIIFMLFYSTLNIIRAAVQFRSR